MGCKKQKTRPQRSGSSPFCCYDPPRRIAFVRASRFERVSRQARPNTPFHGQAQGSPSRWLGFFEPPPIISSTYCGTCKSHETSKGWDQGSSSKTFRAYTCRALAQCSVSPTTTRKPGVLLKNFSGSTRIKTSETKTQNHETGAISSISSSPFWIECHWPVLFQGRGKEHDRCDQEPRTGRVPEEMRGPGERGRVCASLSPRSCLRPILIMLSQSSQVSKNSSQRNGGCHTTRFSSQCIPPRRPQTNIWNGHQNVCHNRHCTVRR